MLRILLKFILIFSLAGFSNPALASTPIQAQAQATQQTQLSQFVTYEEFNQFARTMATKVNLFRDAWAVNPQAEFYGGTSRDFVYFLLGQLSKAQSRQEALDKMNAMWKIAEVDIRSFISPESDIDILSSASLNLSAEKYGVAKIDYIDAARLNPNTVLGKNEIDQGFIPAEKIRLGFQGFSTQANLGEGAKELFEGKLSIHFAERAAFDKTHYAQQGINHPILLAIRYLRLISTDYYYRHGRGPVQLSDLLKNINPSDYAEVKATFASAKEDSRFAKALKNEKFVQWLNALVRKSFRSYANANASLVLFRDSGADDLLASLSGLIKPYKDLLFAKSYDRRQIETNMALYHVDADLFFTPTQKIIPEGSLYHGTKTEEAFRSIIFQGVLPSTDGTAGAGFYAVRIKNIDFANEWAGSPDRVVKTSVSPQARIVDLVGSAEAKRVWSETQSLHGGDTGKFAALFGVDIIKYVYPTPAFVVKNSAVLGDFQGVTRKLLTVGEMLAEAEKVDASSEKSINVFLNNLALNSLSEFEVGVVLERASGMKELTQTRMAAFEKSLQEDISLPADELKEAMALASKNFSLFEMILRSQSLDKIIKEKIMRYFINSSESFLLLARDPNVEKSAMNGNLGKKLNITSTKPEANVSAGTLVAYMALAKAMRQGLDIDRVNHEQILKGLNKLWEKDLDASFNSMKPHPVNWGKIFGEDLIDNGVGYFTSAFLLIPTWVPLAIHQSPGIGFVLASIPGGLFTYWTVKKDVLRVRKNLASYKVAKEQFAKDQALARPVHELNHEARRILLDSRGKKTPESNEISIKSCNSIL